MNIRGGLKEDVNAISASANNARVKNDAATAKKARTTRTKKTATVKTTVPEPTPKPTPETESKPTQPVQPVVSVKEIEEDRADFRDLSEPQRTLARTKFILRNHELTSTMKVAAALLVQEFYGIESHRKTLSISDLFPVSDGYTSMSRITTMAKLEKLGLIRREVRRGEGQDIILNF